MLDLNMDPPHPPSDVTDKLLQGHRVSDTQWQYLRADKPITIDQ